MEDFIVFDEDYDGVDDGFFDDDDVYVYDSDDDVYDSDDDVYDSDDDVYDSDEKLFLKGVIHVKNVTFLYRELLWVYDVLSSDVEEIRKTTVYCYDDPEEHNLGLKYDYLGYCKSCGRAQCEFLEDVHGDTYYAALLGWKLLDALLYVKLDDFESELETAMALGVEQEKLQDIFLSLLAELYRSISIESDEEGYYLKVTGNLDFIKRYFWGLVAEYGEGAIYMEE